MEKLQFHKIHLSPFAALLFLLQFLSLAYSLTENNFFINCGSATNANTDLRNFVGDLNSSDSISSSFSFTGHSSPVTNSNQSSGTSSTLYQTARIFRSNSSYEFDIPNNDIYFVRLHFFAFSTPTNLYTALFDVWTSGSSLLLNFTGKNSSNSPIIKEFFLPISPGKFNVYFLPRGSSFGFINAIEVFPANDSYIPDEAKQISSAGGNNTYRGLRSWTLQTIYRINVGGPKITPENDTLWRNWDPDDGYLVNSGSATSVPPPSSKLEQWHSSEPPSTGRSHREHLLEPPTRSPLSLSRSLFLSLDLSLPLALSLSFSLSISQFLSLSLKLSG